MLLTRDGGEIDMGDMSVGERVVISKVFVSLGRIVSAITVRGQLLHYFVPSLLMVTIKNSPRSPAGQVLQTGISHSQPTTMPKPSMKISIPEQLGSNPTIFHATLVALQLLR